MRGRLRAEPALFVERLKPAAPIDPKRLAQLIADLRDVIGRRDPAPEFGLRAEPNPGEICYLSLLSGFGQFVPQRLVISQKLGPALDRRHGPPDFAQSHAVVDDLAQQTEQFAVRVNAFLVVVKVVDVTGANPRLQQPEAFVDGAVLHVRRIGVPAGAHRCMIGNGENPMRMGWKLRALSP